MSHGLIRLVAGVGGKLFRAVYLARHETLNYFLHSTCFKVSECEDVSIIIIIQVKFSCFFVAWFHTIDCRGRGKLSRTVYLAPNRITKVEFWMLIPLISNYQNVKMYHL